MSDMEAEMPAERIWTLSDVRLQLPPLPIDGMPEPLGHLDFDAEMIEEILQRLSVLRAQMLPSRQRN